MIQSKHWSRNQPLLRQLLAVGRVGVISDFDGTLSPFVRRAADATIAPACARALDGLLARQVPIALVSGRGVGDLRRRFAREGVGYYGNHGLEYWDDTDGQVVDEARPWRDRLLAALVEIQSYLTGEIWVEDKGVTAAVHYRLAVDPAAAAILAVHLTPICARHDLLLSAGNGVWEIKPPLARNKGTAVWAVVEQQALDGVLFLGDDRTDLTAMVTLLQLRDAGVLRRGVAVGVLHPMGNPPELYDCCDLVADGVDDVARLLGWLMAHVPEGAGVARAQ